MAVLVTKMQSNVIEVQFGTDTGTWAWNDTSSWSSDTTGTHLIQNEIAQLAYWWVDSVTFMPSSGGDYWNIFDGSTAGPLAYTVAAMDPGTTGGVAYPRSQYFANGLKLRPVFSRASSDIATTTSKMIFTLK